MIQLISSKGNNYGITHMYKFTNINIDHLKGGELWNINIFAYSIMFIFEPSNFIQISGRWAILNKDGSTYDSGTAQKHKTAIKVHYLLHSKIEGYSIPSPEELHITFSNGAVLIVYDDFPQYECCDISPNISV